MAIIVGELNKTLQGTNQDDELHVRGRATVYGKAGNDVMIGDDEANTFYGGDGNDTITPGNGSDVAYGGNGSDNIGWWDTLGNKNFYGQAGNDQLTSGGGNDFLDGGAGDDYLFSFSGNDSLRGGTGNDILYFFSDNEAVPPGQDSFSGGSDIDTLRVLVERAESDPRQFVEVRMNGESSGTIGYSGGLGSSNFVQAGSFTGINVIQMLNEDLSLLSMLTLSSLLYRGDLANTNMRIDGSLFADDILVGGRGNEVFSGSGGDDRFIFRFDPVTMGRDVILDFGTGDPDEVMLGIPFFGTDSLSFWGGEGQLRTERAENADGVVTFTSFYNDDRLAHVLEVRPAYWPSVTGAGIPDIEYDAFLT